MNARNAVTSIFAAAVIAVSVANSHACDAEVYQAVNEANESGFAAPTAAAYRATVEANDAGFDNEANNLLDKSIGDLWLILKTGQVK